MNERSSLAERLEHEIEEVAGLSVVVEDTGADVVVTGFVDSEEEHVAVRDIVERAVGERRGFSDNIEVRGALPGQSNIGELSELQAAGFEGADRGLEDSEHLDPGDFTDEPSKSSPDLAQIASLSDAPSDEPDLASTGDVVYVPPIDPVGDNTTVIGGFQTSSMASIDVERSSDGTIGDEAIRDAVMRELREDAATHALAIEVSVIAGVVRLTGRVDDINDVESAEEVAARVPGVLEVIEELEVEHFS